MGAASACVPKSQLERGRPSMARDETSQGEAARGVALKPFSFLVFGSFGGQHLFELDLPDPTLRSTQCIDNFHT